MIDEKEISERILYIRFVRFALHDNAAQLR